MIKPRGFLTLTCLVVAVVWASAAVSAEKAFRIGIVTDGPWQQNQIIQQRFVDEILALTSGDYDVQFPEELRIECDYTAGSIRTALRRLLDDPGCDMVLALGVIASHEGTHMTRLPKPLIAPFVIDPQLQQTPTEGAASGVPNLSYLLSPFNLQRDLSAFAEYLEFHKMVLLSSAPFVAAIPQLRTHMMTHVAKDDVEVVVVRVHDSAQEALAAIPPDADAVFLSGLIHLPTAEFAALIEGINERKLPSFSLMGKMDVARGVLMGLAPETTFPRFARRVALHVQQILMGVDAGTLPIAQAGGERLTVNMATARRIGVFPSWEVLTEAELIGVEERHVARTWSFRSVMDEALRVNRDLVAAEREVRAGAQDVTRARAALLPRIDLGGVGLVIDEDRAEAGLGSQPQRTVTGSLSGSQVIWSERAWAGYSIEKSVQRAREHDHEATRLDVALEALTAFLDVLSAKTQERIVRENLKLTRSNLELARVRRAIGIGGPSEVYRWESALANVRQEVIDANARRNLLEIELNRVLYRPAEEPFDTEEFGLDDPDVVRYRAGIMTYFDNPYSFKALRMFLADEGLRLSPELQSLEAAIAAQERVRDSSTYAFFSPDLVLFGGVDHRLWKDGAGVEPPAMTGFPQPDDSNWNVGLELRLPLWTSGARVADRRQATEELIRLRVGREALAQRIEQRIRSALHRAGAAYAAIRQRRTAAEASMKNLQLVVDSYSQGTMSILDLIDAQTSAFLSESLAANAVYEFFIQLMEVERSIGRFYFFASQEEIDAIGDRFDRHLEQNPITY
jgi:outer membrane protein TolC